MLLATSGTTTDPTMMHLLERQARERPNLTAYRFLREDGAEESITYAELARRARAIAAKLRQAGEVGDRALLIFPPGLDFITAFFGCIFAGVLAVPATFAKPNRSASRLAAIATDSTARLALTTRQSLAALRKRRVCPELAGLEWLAVDEIGDEGAEQWKCPSLEGNDLVFLQYTSGSTSAPKGVMISHHNLLHNLETIRRGFGLPVPAPGESAGTGVSWLPAYHDMGLIGGMLESLYVGGESVVFSPTAFLQRPLRWLEAISKYGALVSGAPNFAFELCAQRASAEDVDGLDLSRWKVAFCGAEPISAETLERFAETFAPCGFRAGAFYCCYGLAEATLLVTGGRAPSVPVIRTFARSALAERRVAPPDSAAPSDSQRLVGCGSSLRDQKIAIVDPATGRPAPPERMGEIWVKGPHVSRGYWNREAENAATFGAQLAGDAGGRYLRTGDLGFFVGEELFVAGRLKDVLIVRGRNLYPHDIERTAAGAHPALAPGGGAAFGVPFEDREGLVVVHEVDRRARADADAIFRSIRREVTAEHEVDVSAIVLIRRASLPRTTSGKVQRFMCRERYLAGELKVISTWSRNGAPDAEPAGEGSVATAEGQGQQREAASRDAAVPQWKLPPLLPRNFEPGARRLTDLEIERLARRIEGALLEWLVRQGGAPEESVEPNRPFAEYGVDSLAAVELIQQLQENLRMRLTPVMVWNYPTPAAMAAHLARRIGDPEAEQRAEEEDAEANLMDVEALLSDVERLSDEEAKAFLESSPERIAPGWDGAVDGAPVTGDGKSGVEADRDGFAGSAAAEHALPGN